MEKYSNDSDLNQKMELLSKMFKSASILKKSKMDAIEYLYSYPDMDERRDYLSFQYAVKSINFKKKNKYEIPNKKRGNKIIDDLIKLGLNRLDFYYYTAYVGVEIMISAVLDQYDELGYVDETLILFDMIQNQKFPDKMRQYDILNYDPEPFKAFFLTIQMYTESMIYSLPIVEQLGELMKDYINEPVQDDLEELSRINHDVDQLVLKNPNLDLYGIKDALDRVINLKLGFDNPMQNQNLIKANILNALLSVELTKLIIKHNLSEKIIKGFDIKSINIFQNLINAKLVSDKTDELIEYKKECMRSLELTEEGLRNSIGALSIARCVIV